MPTLDVGDTTLWYTEVGEGIPCLVLHGGLGLDHAYFRPEMDRLAQSVRLVYVDHRGHGRSGRPPPATITHAKIVEDLEALRKHLGAEQVMLLGHSYGGFLALEYATRHPDRVCHLILTGTGSAMDTWEETARIVRSRAEKEPTAAKTWFEAGYHDDDSFRDWLRAIGPLYFRADAAPWKHVFDRITYVASSGARISTTLAGWDLTPQLATIKARTLVLHGRHDFVLPAQQAERLVKGIPGADLVMFENSGHFPWLEEPEAFFAAVDEWFAKQAAEAQAAA